MGYYIGFSIRKEEIDGFTYADMAVWCNSNNAHITSDGNSYIIEKNEVDEDVLVVMEVDELKRYLAETDYVVTKLTEYSILGRDISTLTSEYEDVLTRREEARNRINELTSVDNFEDEGE